MEQSIVGIFKNGRYWEGARFCIFDDLKVFFCKLEQTSIDLALFLEGSYQLRFELFSIVFLHHLTGSLDVYANFLESIRTSWEERDRS